jgi:hypothetical protein
MVENHSPEEVIAAVDDHFERWFEVPGLRVF